MMTQGKFGSIFHLAPDEYRRVPAFATNVVDRVGAGDAVLCVTAMCAAMGCSAEATAFIGNVVGAEAVAILGNQRSIERIPLYRHIECLLKVHQAEGEAPKKALRFVA
jgi:bifunctional ADP-heptose synthase (sugar kinase/adenylyltransferase)